VDKARGGERRGQGSGGVACEVERETLMSYESGNGCNATHPLHKPPHAHDTHMNQSTESGNGRNEILPQQRLQRNPPVQAKPTSINHMT